MKVGVFIGELADAPADVICTSTNPQLNAFRGSDAALRKRGGAELRADSNALLEREELRTGHRQVPAGCAPATGPGTLLFQAVVHCVAFDAQGTTPEVITGCVRNALMTLSGLRPRPQRVAMPVLGADNGKFEFDAALRLMADLLKATVSPPFDMLWIVLPDAKHQAAAQRILAERFGTVEVQPVAGP